MSTPSATGLSMGPHRQGPRPVSPAPSPLLASEEGLGGGLLHPGDHEALVDVFRGCRLDTPCGLAHPDRRHRWFGLELGATDEHQLDVTHEGARREAPAPIDAVVGHPPLHGAPKARYV